jgi:hypothetical protein
MSKKWLHTEVTHREDGKRQKRADDVALGSHYEANYIEKQIEEQEGSTFPYDQIVRPP